MCKYYRLVWPMCEWFVCLQHQNVQDGSLVNMRVVWFAQHRNVQVQVWSMCEWSDFHNTRMFVQSASLVNVQVV